MSKTSGAASEKARPKTAILSCRTVSTERSGSAVSSPPKFSSMINGGSCKSFTWAGRGTSMGGPPETSVTRCRERARQISRVRKKWPTPSTCWAIVENGSWFPPFGPGAALAPVGRADSGWRIPPHRYSRAVSRPYTSRASQRKSGPSGFCAKLHTIRLDKNGDRTRAATAWGGVATALIGHGPRVQGIPPRRWPIPRAAKNQKTFFCHRTAGLQVPTARSTRKSPESRESKNENRRPSRRKYRYGCRRTGRAR